MADAHDAHYYKELGQKLHEFIRPLVVDVLVREVGPVLEDPVARRIAREEVASLCGLVLRRCIHGTDVTPPHLRALAEIFGEALRDFSSDTGEPGK